MVCHFFTPNEWRVEVALAIHFNGDLTQSTSKMSNTSGQFNDIKYGNSYFGIANTECLEDEQRVPPLGLNPHHWEQELSSPFTMSSTGNDDTIDGHMPSHPRHPHLTQQTSIGGSSTYDSGVEVSFCSTLPSGLSETVSGLQSINESGCVSDNLTQQFGDLDLGGEGDSTDLYGSSSVPVQTEIGGCTEQYVSCDDAYVSSEISLDSPVTSEVQEQCQWTIAFQQDEDGDTLLHLAIIQKDEYHAECLLAQAPSYRAMDLQNNLLQTPLHLAILTGLTSGGLLRRLLAGGATPDLRDRNGNTALHLACKAGDRQAVRTLTTPLMGEEITSIPYELPSSHACCIPQNLDLRNYEGETCLHLAAAGDHTDIVRYLVNCGADINVQEAKSGRTILHRAVEKENLILAHTILSLPGVDPQVQDYAQRSALGLVAGYPTDKPIVQLLLKHGAIPDDLEVYDSDEDDMTEPHYDDFAIQGEPI